MSRVEKAVVARARSIAHQDNRCDALETIQRKLINGVENLYQRVDECVSDERERRERGRERERRASRGIASVSREVEAGAARARSYARQDIQRTQKRLRSLRSNRKL